MKIKFGVSDIVQAFNEKAVGTKVTNREEFEKILETAVQAHDSMFVVLPDEALKFVVSGVGRKTTNPDDYIAREWRGNVELFLKREKAEPVTGCAVVVYTRKAYQDDPEVDKARFLHACADEAVTHVVVAVLAFAGPKPPVSPLRFAANLAGANNEYNALARLDKHMSELAAPKGGGKGVYRDSKNGFEEQARFLAVEFKKLQALAREVAEYEESWKTVAD